MFPAGVAPRVLASVSAAIVRVGTHAFNPQPPRFPCAAGANLRGAEVNGVGTDRVRIESIFWVS